MCNKADIFLAELADLLEKHNMCVGTQPHWEGLHLGPRGDRLTNIEIWFCDNTDTNITCSIYPDRHKWTHKDIRRQLSGDRYHEDGLWWPKEGGHACE